MFGPRIRAFARPNRVGATRCLCQPAPRRTPRTTVFINLQQRRHQSSGRSAMQNLKILWRHHPFSVTLALSIILLGSGGLLFTNYIYQTYIIGAFHKFPEPVAKQLRKALYYTNISLEPQNAIKYYKEALRVADEVGMDPFSDEILGVKIQLAGLMEKINQYQKAIEVLVIVRNDCLKWMEVLGSKKENEEKRDRVLRKTIQISVKISDLYANPYVQNQEAAEEMLLWAVTTALREQQTRKAANNEDPWLDPQELGASIEGLAHHYEEKDQHYLAAPLFLQALTLSPPNSCHTAVIMNNLSISIAQQDPPSTPGQPPLSRPAMINNARQWAGKALEIAGKIQPPERTEECDVGCAVAIHNLGEFAEMDGDIVEARKKYEEAKSLAKAIQFKEGVKNANASLERLRKT